jgi:nucleoside-diphosphate-sugar epimerase
MKVSGKDLPIEQRPKTADDPRRRCPDIAKARAELGFSPKVGLEEGIRATYADFARRLGR